MFYIVTLGNPGEKYSNTRHNVGWQALDYCIDDWQLPGLVESGALSGRTSSGMVSGVETTILYPSTYMNSSGSAVAKLVSKDECERLVVVHDDIDVPFGEIKIGKGRGAGGNNGVQSIIEKMDTKDFVRVRIGIAPKSFWTGKVKRPAGGGPLERFVLKPFTPAETKLLPEVFDLVNKGIVSVLTEGVEVAMNKYNQKVPL